MAYSRLKSLVVDKDYQASSSSCRLRVLPSVRARRSLQGGESGIQAAKALAGEQRRTCDMIYAHDYKFLSDNLDI